MSKPLTLSPEKKLEKFKSTVVEFHKSLVATKPILLLSPAFSSIQHSEKDVPKEAITFQKQSCYGTSSIQLSISIKSFLSLANFSHPLASKAFSPSQCPSFPLDHSLCCSRLSMHFLKSFRLHLLLRFSLSFSWGTFITLSVGKVF